MSQFATCFVCELPECVDPKTDIYKKYDDGLVFMSLTILFKSYPDNGRVIMKGSVQCSAKSHKLNAASSGILTRTSCS